MQQTRRAKGRSIERPSKRSGVPGRLIREPEDGGDTYVPSETNTALLAGASRVPAGPLLGEREPLFGRWCHKEDGVG